MSNRFDRYNGHLIALLKESISCSPESWQAGYLTIDCDGSYMNYSLKNASSEDKAQISGQLRQLCEDLYVEMRESGDWWVKAVLHFFREDGSWSYKLDFTYQDQTATLQHLERQPHQESKTKPWWKFWS
ncbi:hypothetical protein SAMN05518865_1278 [Duganella sp. CF458]|uniref:hypothetical protein n=1 Tax=Duganella sp. CF458 TaxID=1884368 RepID=UPI0008EB08FE|nr:hypothetical protein [Duganella sp. CF458]SFG98560.1 hypothetical protein SAMN05518865_1278 [Duganella sp. CF458]